MQKKIIALAIASAFAAPVAMADVTMYGTMDGGFRHQTNDSPAQGTTDSMQMGQYNTARFGLKSVEDMGDGMKTTVVLETSYAPAGVGSNPAMTPNASATAQATGNASNPFGLLFDRQATIGVSAGWGSIDMGWNYTTSFKVIKTYDPLDYKWLGQAMAKTSDTQDRAGSVTYTGKFGDVGVIAEYDVTDATKTSQPNQQGNARALGVTYASGPINAGAAYTAQEPNVAAGYDNGMTHITAGAGFNFGDGKVSVGYAKKTTKTNPATTAGDNTATNMWLGGNYKVTGATNVSAAYYSRATNTGAAGAADVNTKVMLVGATYDLSKKTQLYVSVDKTTVSTNGAADVVTSGSTLGLSTVF